MQTHTTPFIFSINIIHLKGWLAIRSTAGA